MTTTYTYSDELFSDFHKDAFGFRPSSDQMARWNAMSPDEKQDEWDYLDRSLENNIAREKAEADRAVVDFERWLETEISIGAGDEETALRWMTSVEREDGWMKHSQDAEQWVWKQGILFTDRGREVVEILKRIYKMEY